MEKPTFTIAQIRDNVSQALPPQKDHYEKRRQPLSLNHLVYIAERKARERSGEEWKIPISLDPNNPPQYDMAHAAGILDELAEMTENDIPRRVQSSYAIGLTQDVVDQAERILLQQHHTPSYDMISEAQKPEEIDPREPYLFRGHHLAITKGLLMFSPKIAAEKIAHSQRISYEMRYKDMTTHPELYTDAALAYYPDVIGNTSDEADNWKDILKKNYQEFIDLPDDYPVELLTGMKDKICESCVIGKHCTVKTSEVRGTSMIDHDRAVIAVFVNEAREMGYANDLHVVTKTASFSDAPREEVEAIRTTVGTIKTVLHSSKVDWGDIYNVVPLEELWLKNRPIR